MLEDLSFLRIGFRKNPNVVLNARPMIGERDVNIQQVTHLIEDKILLEFQVSGQLPAGCGSEVQHFIQLMFIISENVGFAQHGELRHTNHGRPTNN